MSLARAADCHAHVFFGAAYPYAPDAVYRPHPSQAGTNRAGVRIMVDHFGRPDVARGVGHPGFRTLLELGRAGRAVVKLSGPFRASVEGYPSHDVDPFVAAAITGISWRRRAPRLATGAHGREATSTRASPSVSFTPFSSSHQTSST